MKERVRLMKCQNKKKNVKRAVAGIIFLSVIAIILSAYGVTQMYASPEKKALKTMLKSGELLQSTVEKYINNIDVSANNYTEKINISELIYDNADYMQGKNSAEYTITANIDNNGINVVIPELTNDTFLISKADISRYINIDADQLKPVLKAALADFVKGYEVMAMDCVNTVSETGKHTYNINIDETALVNGFNTFVDELYKDSQVLPYISLLNVYGIKKDSIKSEFATEVKDCNVVLDIEADRDNNLVKVSAVVYYNQNAVCNMVIDFDGLDNMTLYIMAEYSQAEYVNSVIQIDMQSDNVIGVSADADIHFMNHSSIDVKDLKCTYRNGEDNKTRETRTLATGEWSFETVLKSSSTGVLSTTPNISVTSSCNADQTINIDTLKCDGFVLDIYGTGNADFKWFGMSGKYAPVVHLKDGTVVSIDNKTSDLSAKAGIMHISFALKQVISVDNIASIEWHGVTIYSAE